MVLLYISQLIMLFIVIFLAVRFAISPLIPKTVEQEKEKEVSDVGLVKLRDMEVLTNTELEEIIELYHSKHAEDKENRHYGKYLKVLNELKENGYFTHDEHAEKVRKLNEYYLK